jgi:hypothetical protein
MPTISLVIAILGLTFGLCSLLWLLKASSSWQATGLRLDQYYSGLISLQEKLSGLETDVPAPKLMELQALFGQLKEEFDGLLVANDKHRSQVHNSIQRFDAIMRRNEAAAKKLEADEGLQIPEDDAAAEQEISQLGDRSFLEPASNGLPTAPTAQEGPVERQRRLRERWFANRRIG